MARITITHLARNLAEVVSRVADREERFTVVRGNRPVVELVPPAQGRRPGGSAPYPRPRSPLGEAEAGHMKSDLDEARAEMGKVPRDSRVS